MRFILPFALLLTACADLAPFPALGPVVTPPMTAAQDDTDIAARIAALAARAALLRGVDQGALQ